jgi:hypothetical protein
VRGPDAGPVAFDAWLAHFRAQPARQRELEDAIPWGAPESLNPRAKRAFIRSFQWFELGENADGRHLLGKAAQEGDPVYLAALTLLVAEEQRHSSLFARGLEHLGAPRLDAHWSDAAFSALRRMLGLRTELALFLIAETVAMGYFTALAERAPDPVLRGIGRRIAEDERHHIRFQVDRLRHGFRRTPRPGRWAVQLGWTVVAAGAASVLALDHRGALTACGLEPARYWGQAMGEFRRAAAAALAPSQPGLDGPR